LFWKTQITIKWEISKGNPALIFIGQ